MASTPNRLRPEPSGDGRRARNYRATRARLLSAAYDVMSDGGVDSARIKDITDRADIGFGTFYNYFIDKDAVARGVLDCMIHNLGERIEVATAHLRGIDTALQIGAANRLVLRSAMSDPIWRWWALRPDLLFDRMSKGLGPFAIEDVRQSIEAGVSTLALDQIESAWALATWLMVGGIHDVVVGDRPPESETFVAYSIMRMLGSTHEAAQRATSIELPACAPRDIDWTFKPNR